MSKSVCVRVCVFYVAGFGCWDCCVWVWWRGWCEGCGGVPMCAITVSDLWALDDYELPNDLTPSCCSTLLSYSLHPHAAIPHLMKCHPTLNHYYFIFPKTHIYYTHTCKPTHTHTNTHRHPPKHSHKQPNTETHTHTSTHTNTHTQTLTQTHTHTETDTQTHTHTDTAQTHTQTHTHIHIETSHNVVHKQCDTEAMQLSFLVVLMLAHAFISHSLMLSALISWVLHAFMQNFLMPSTIISAVA